MLEQQLTQKWVVNPYGDACIINKHQLLKSLSPLTGWSPMDKLVQLTGAMGSYELSINKSEPTSRMRSLYLSATTIGQVSSYFRFNILICRQNSLKAYQSQIYYYLPKGQTSVGYDGLLLSNYSQLFEVSECDHCNRPDFKLITSNSQATLIQMTNDFKLLVNTTRSFVTEVGIEAFYDPNTQPECAQIIDPVRITAKFEVCGSEQIQVNFKDLPVEFKAWQLWDQNFKIDMTNYMRNFSSSSPNCPIVSFEIQSEFRRNINESNPRWSKIVSFTAPSLSIAHNNLNLIENNTVIPFYLVATTLGGVQDYKIFTVRIAKPPVNKAPYFTREFREGGKYKLVIEAEKLKNGIQKAMWVEILPIIEDLEGDVPIVTVIPRRIPKCGCVEVKEVSGRWVLEVDKF